MKLSIIIPIYNQFNYTKALINDISRCIKTPSSEYEVILIDNASTDETKDFFTDIDFVKDMCKIDNLEYYRMNENIFVNPAWNFGVEKAKGEYIMICNNDIILTEGIDLHLIENIKDNIMITSPIYTEGEKEWNGRWYKGNKWNPFNICGHCWCQKKDTRVPIPDKLKIRYGDNWIYENMVAKKCIELAIPSAKIHHYGSGTISKKNYFIENIINKDTMQRELLKKRGL